MVPALGAILGDKQREEYNIDFFENFGVPAYAVTVTGTELDDEVVQQIKQYFQKDLKEHRHSTLVLTAQKDITDPEAQDISFNWPRDKADHRKLHGQVIRRGERFSNGLRYPRDRESTPIKE
ncbi:hypothetical protein SAMN05444487_101430 [Marininema mesophilum]|uniref:Uncharacterized protein n=1 Tax=Marininema mesophilum TaxID=1048340 RepID=A0A1H2RCE7_9BACL|nr:hypothetical protein [Marininema mesophilum]SDW16985.1 hypothetical protein SAMN05444487_101430 [Marininema mesophilum]